MTTPYRPTSTETIIVTPYQWKKFAALLITEFAPLSAKKAIPAPMAAPYNLLRTVPTMLCCQASLLHYLQRYPADTARLQS
jgi:hypothetical protein